MYFPFWASDNPKPGRTVVVPVARTVRFGAVASTPMQLECAPKARFPLVAETELPVTASRFVPVALTNRTLAVLLPATPVEGRVSHAASAAVDRRVSAIRARTFIASRDYE